MAGVAGKERQTGFGWLGFEDPHFFHFRPIKGRRTANENKRTYRPTREPGERELVPSTFYSVVCSVSTQYLVVRVNTEVTGVVSTGFVEANSRKCLLAFDI